VEAANGFGFVVVDLENGIQLRDLKQVFYAL
jgi:hypothetical protein